MSSHATKPNIGLSLEPGWEIMNSKLVHVHIKGSMAPELLEDLICLCSIRSQCTINNLLFMRSVCIAHVIAMTIPHSIGDQDVLSNYDGNGDDDDIDNDSE